MEPALQAALLLGLFLVPCSHAQGAVSGTTAGSNTLQPWLVGLTAVMCFLCVIFMASLINRFFCSKKKDTEETQEKNVDLRTTPNIYDNIAMEVEEGTFQSAEQRGDDDKQTNL
ncbi:small integral membrane protein 24 [Eublepharis macularius]|uniref:Small integral membrane protein 24 n=1 Tax=Eublepharis macularius TaxID=481883 RepID=A0AA97L099_EUBMA|nr:small integral membrane protein 24 [Eublepharis macularius]